MYKGKRPVGEKVSRLTNQSGVGSSILTTGLEGLPDSGRGAKAGQLGIDDAKTGVDATQGEQGD